MNKNPFKTLTSAPEKLLSETWVKVALLLLTALGGYIGYLVGSGSYQEALVIIGTTLLGAAIGLIAGITVFRAIGTMYGAWQWIRETFTAREQ